MKTFQRIVEDHRQDFGYYNKTHNDERREEVMDIILPFCFEERLGLQGLSFPQIEAKIRRMERLAGQTFRQ